MSLDLPDLTITSVPAASQVRLVERVGDPGTEQVVTSLRFARRDVHSTATGLAIVRVEGNAYAYSMERWVQLRLDLPSSSAANVRFWSDNYSPNSGWQILWGLADTYQPPTVLGSDIATGTLPTEPSDDPNLPDLAVADGVLTSQWIVLQARVESGGAAQLQGVPVDLNFSWEQC